MANIHDDPPEFTGTTQATKADPKGGPKSEMVAKAKVSPAAVYVPPKANEAHPKVARKSVAERLDNAEAALNAASAELTAALGALRSAELLEGDALAALLKELPPPSANEVNRARLAAEQAAKQARVDAGLSPTAPKVPTHGHSPIDQAAAARPRTSAQQPTGSPLRSPVVRRNV